MGDGRGEKRRSEKEFKALHKAVKFIILEPGSGLPQKFIAVGTPRNEGEERATENKKQNKYLMSYTMPSEIIKKTAIE